MAWIINFLPEALDDLKELDRSIAKRILKVLHEKIANLKDPRSIGEALRGPQLGKYWKYRIGDYRVISKINDADIEILIIKIGNRREVYR
jgi:mRNA interferase RelE/StbE